MFEIGHFILFILYTILGGFYIHMGRKYKKYKILNKKIDINIQDYEHNIDDETSRKYKLGYDYATNSSYIIMGTIYIIVGLIYFFLAWKEYRHAEHIQHSLSSNKNNIKINNDNISELNTSTAVPVNLKVLNQDKNHNVRFRDAVSRVMRR